MKNLCVTDISGHSQLKQKQFKQRQSKISFGGSLAQNAFWRDSRLARRCVFQYEVSSAKRPVQLDADFPWLAAHDCRQKLIAFCNGVAFRTVTAAFKQLLRCPAR